MVKAQLLKIAIANSPSRSVIVELTFSMNSLDFQLSDLLHIVQFEPNFLK